MQSQQPLISVLQILFAKRGDICGAWVSLREVLIKCLSSFRSPRVHSGQAPGEILQSTESTTYCSASISRAVYPEYIKGLEMTACSEIPKRVQSRAGLRDPSPSAFRILRAPPPIYLRSISLSRSLPARILICFVCCLSAARERAMNCSTWRTRPS